MVSVLAKTKAMSVLPSSGIRSNNIGKCNITIILKYFSLDS